MQRFTPLLNAMPYEAMSGDEECTKAKDDTIRFEITNLRWRNPAPEIRAWFKTLDALHMSTRFAANDRPLAGRFPHRRIPSKRMEPVDIPVPKLPRNFYDPNWLETLDEIERDILQIQPAIDLAFSPQISLHVFPLFPFIWAHIFSQHRRAILQC
jgi:hypothetical protein